MLSAQYDDDDNDNDDDDDIDRVNTTKKKQ